MGLFDAIASSAANIADNVVGMVNQNHQNKVNLRMMREQNAFNAEQARVQRDWQERMWGKKNTEKAKQLPNHTEKKVAYP
jgi:hypothetical protein